LKYLHGTSQGQADQIKAFRPIRKRYRATTQTAVRHGYRDAKRYKRFVDLAGGLHGALAYKK